MALSEQKILALKIEYELGKLSKTAICKLHKISRPTLRKHAKASKWIYQQSFQKVSEEVEKRTIERLVEKNTDIVGETTERFIKDVSKIRSVTASLMDAMAKDLKKNDGNITAAEANRLLTCQKVNKVAGETITNIYNTVRKALGMDRDEDVKKALAIKHGDRPEDDPTSSIEDRINAKMKAHGFDK